jgi:hypothetical protein
MKYIGGELNLILQKGAMADGQWKYYGVMDGQEPCGIINQVSEGFDNFKNGYCYLL